MSVEKVFEQFDIPAQHAALSSELEKVGLDNNNDQPLPTLENVAAGLTPEVQKFLLERSEASHGDRLVIAPYLGKLNLEGFMDCLGYDFAEYYAETRLSRDPVRHNQTKDEKAWSLGFMLRDKTDPLTQEPVVDPGLVYVNKTVYKQTRDLKKEARLIKEAAGVVVRPVTLMEYAVDDHVHEPIEDPDTVKPHFRGTTRLPHLPTPNIGYAPFGQRIPIYARFSPGGHPGAPETDRGILWTTSSAFLKYPTSGVRRVLDIS